MKQFVRRFLTNNQWQFLVSRKAAIRMFWYSEGGPKVHLYTGFGHWVANYLNALPLRLLAVLKESVTPIGLMDYRNKQIRMFVDSTFQFNRLRPCYKEPETVNWIETHIRPNDVFYDVGANVGGYSFIAFSATDGKVKVYAFEPGFSTFAQLSKNVLLNQAQGKILPLCVAISNETKISNFNYSDLSPGAANHKLGEIVSGVDHPSIYIFNQPVLSYRLDDLINVFKLEVPDLMKIDVDGCELEVLKGAENTLQNPKVRSILIEVDDLLPNNSQNIEACLKGMGFVLNSKHRHGETNISNHVFMRGNE